MDRFKIFNGKVITKNRIIENGCVIVENDKIVYVGKDIDDFNGKVYNANGNYISPGFVDIHCHGGGGYDFMDHTKEAFLKGVKAHTLNGTTSIVPTTLASTMDDLLLTFKAYKDVKSNSQETKAKMLGIHLEGPYFSKIHAGAQDPLYIKPPNKYEYEKILSMTDDIIRWSIAPELDGAIELGDLLIKNGILPSIAHSDAKYNEVIEAYEHGYTLITHFYSAMSTVKKTNAYRHAGVIESGYIIDDMDVEIIADGKHLPKSLLKLIYKIKGPNHIALITDAMRAASQNVNESILGSIENGQRVIIEDGVAKMPDRKAFAGSVATTNRLVRTMVTELDLDIVEAVKMMTHTPARIMGLSKEIGSLSINNYADIIIFDEKINILKMWVNGNLVQYFEQ